MGSESVFLIRELCFSDLVFGASRKKGKILFVSKSLNRVR